MFLWLKTRSNLDNRFLLDHVQVDARKKLELLAYAGALCSGRLHTMGFA